MKGDAERCLAAGMDAYVAKPLQPRELEAAIARVIAPAVAEEPARPLRASAPSPEPGVVDFPRLLERVGGDRKALAQLVRIFRADSPSQISRIRKAIRESDAPALRSAAHAVKGAVSNFAAAAATGAAARLQRMGDTGHLAGAEAALARLEREIGRVLEVLAEDSRPLPRGSRTAGSARRPRPPGRAAAGAESRPSSGPLLAGVTRILARCTDRGTRVRPLARAARAGPRRTGHRRRPGARGAPRDRLGPRGRRERPATCPLPR